MILEEIYFSGYILLTGSFILVIFINWAAKCLVALNCLYFVKYLVICETHRVVVRRLTQKENSTKASQQEDVVEATLLRPTGTNRSS